MGRDEQLWISPKKKKKRKKCHSILTMKHTRTQIKDDQMKETQGVTGQADWSDKRAHGQDQPVALVCSCRCQLLRLEEE